MINENYLESIKRQFLYYKNMGEKAMEQMTDEKLFVQFNEDSNSVATIVKHLAGNMISRWTDFFTSDGEKEWRNRDSEFENDIATRAELMKIWNKGWEVCLKTIDSIKPNDLEKIIYIRNQGHTVVDAINRQLAHYPYHIGQIVYVIVYVAKILKNNEWQSLSIPKNRSKDYNTDKFSQPKEIKYFTDEFLKNKKP